MILLISVSAHMLALFASAVAAVALGIRSQGGILPAHRVLVNRSLSLRCWQLVQGARAWTSPSALPTIRAFPGPGSGCRSLILGVALSGTRSRVGLQVPTARLTIDGRLSKE